MQSMCYGLNKRYFLGSFDETDAVKNCLMLMTSLALSLSMATLRDRDFKTCEQASLILKQVYTKY